MRALQRQILDIHLYPFSPLFFIIGHYSGNLGRMIVWCLGSWHLLGNPALHSYKYVFRKHNMSHPVISMSTITILQTLGVSRWNDHNILSTFATVNPRCCGMSFNKITILARCLEVLFHQLQTLSEWSEKMTISSFYLKTFMNCIQIQRRTAEGSVHADPLSSKQDQTDINSGKKGTLETKTYVLKKKSDNKRTFKCSECKFIELSIQKLNKHH